jgi:hypothetical protein
VAKKVTSNPKRKAIVVAFGRFQPPTAGHQLLINSVQDYAAKIGVEHAMFSSRSHDPEKNPLSPSKKFKWLKRFFPKANFTNEASIRTPFDMLIYLAGIGYTDVVMVGGEDRAVMYKGFERLLTKTKERKSLPLKSISFKQAGATRDPNAKGVAGLSGTELRKAVTDNKFKVFVSGLPTGISSLDAKGLFADLRATIKEDTSHHTTKGIRSFKEHWMATASKLAFK